MVAMVRALAGDSTITSALGKRCSFARRGWPRDEMARRPDTILVRWWPCQYPPGPWPQTALVSVQFERPIEEPDDGLAARGAEKSQSRLLRCRGRGLDRRRVAHHEALG